MDKICDIKKLKTILWPKKFFSDVSSKLVGVFLFPGGWKNFDNDKKF